MAAADRTGKISHAERTAAEFIERLAAGTAPWQSPFEQSLLGGLPMNATTGKRYRGINAMTLAMAAPTPDPRWVTYPQACDRGWHVRRGSKSRTIVFPVYEEEKRDKQTGEKRIVKRDQPLFIYSGVFHASQVDGMPELVAPKHDWDPIERVELLLKESAAVIHHHAGATPHYAPAMDHIVMPLRSQFRDATNYALVALHELGHWTGSPERLNRDLANRFGTEGYAREELRAEIGSYLLGQELGIGHDPGNHFAYVASWIQALRDDPREIFRACADAEKIVAFIRQFDRYQDHTQVADATPEQSSRERITPSEAERTTAPAKAPRPVPRGRKARAPKALEMAR